MIASYSGLQSLSNPFYSQADRFLEDLFADVRTDCVFSYDIDFTPKQIFEVLLDRDDVKNASPRF